MLAEDALEAENLEQTDGRRLVVLRQKVEMAGGDLDPPRASAEFVRGPPPLTTPVTWVRVSPCINIPPARLGRLWRSVSQVARAPPAEGVAHDAC
jgi:hypothetical protein